MYYTLQLHQVWFFLREISSKVPYPDSFEIGLDRDMTICFPSSEGGSNKGGTLLRLSVCMLFTPKDAVNL